MAKHSEVYISIAQQSKSEQSNSWLSIANHGTAQESKAKHSHFVTKQSRAWQSIRCPSKHSRATSWQGKAKQQRKAKHGNAYEARQIIAKHSIAKCIIARYSTAKQSIANHTKA